MITDGTWEIDRERSTVAFVGSHLMGLGKVKGRFTGFEASMMAANGELTAAQATISADTITTGNDRRDVDLRSGAFLDVEAHPDLTYTTSTIAAQGAEGRYQVTGTLTVKDHSAEVPLEARVLEGGDGELRVRALGTFDRRTVGVRPGAKSLMVGRLVGVELDLVATLDR